MTGKKHLLFLNAFLIFTVLSTAVSCGFEANKINLLMDREYYPQVKSLIDNAKKSVQVMMFEASYYNKYPGSPSNQLIDALVSARKRGLKVEVILDVQKKNTRTTKRNLETGKILKNAGVEVVFDLKHVSTHAKMLIIDANMVVLGSTNWTYSALTKNHEVSAVIYSKETAKHLEDYFQLVKNACKKP